MKMKNSKSESREPQTFLDTSGTARKVSVFRKDEQIYSQGDTAKSVLYIQTGNVKSSVVSASGKVAAWMGLLGVTMSLGAQIAANHGLVKPGTMGSVKAQDIVDAFEKPAEEPNVPNPDHA